MSTKDFTANVISATKVVPDGNFKDSKASGIWDINEALDLIKGGNWPNVANLNPAAFVDGLFQCHLYTGTGSNQTITNNINLSGSGGLVWSKARSATKNHAFVDTARGANKYLEGNLNNAEGTATNIVTAFNSDGYTAGSGGYAGENGVDYVSWTFRKQPKFFDIVTYSGTGSDRTIAHNLGSSPGMVILKRTDTTGDWWVWHRSATQYNPNNLQLNSTNANVSGDGQIEAVSSTTVTLGTGNDVNNSSGTYVAYLFAHNDDDGGFGEPGDQDIIKCGSYTGNETSPPEINLGFEPQWVLIKRATAVESWAIFDNMRGVVTGGNDAMLRADTSGAVYDAANQIEFTSTGFKLTTAGLNITNTTGTYIYMAIRRGGMQTPTAASDVFAPNYYGTSGYVGYLGAPADMSILGYLSGNSQNAVVYSRLTPNNKALVTSSNAAEISTNSSWDNMFGVTPVGSTNTAFISWTWKRARGYFDVVTYTGNGTAGRTVNHNLGVAPEMMWIKQRDGAGDWEAPCDYTDTTFRRLQLSSNGGSAAVDYTSITSDSHNPLHNKPTATQIILNSAANVNQNTKTYIAALFATLAGVSKVGSFTQSGATNVACGFTGDTPSFILLKRTDDAGDWLTFDSARDIVAGNDKSLALNNTDAQVTNADIVDPYSGGFATTSSLTNGDYIFYAIAAIS